jgi:hypothetical protein
MTVRAALRCALVALLALTIAASAALAEEVAPGPAARPHGLPPIADAPYGWRQVGDDFKYVFGRPAHLDRAGWQRFAWIVGTGVALYAVRKEARDFVLDHTNEGFNNILDGARTMGKLSTPLAVSLGYYLTGLARDSPYDKETSVMILENLGYAGMITGTMQYVFATDRPEYGDDINFFAQNGHSASGDVTIAASILSPVIERHLLVQPDDGRGVRFWKRFGAGALYGTAGLTALQRMALDKHWLPDVYFGYVNGLMVGKMLVDSHRGGREWREARRHRVEVDITPAGVRIAWPVRPAAAADAGAPAQPDTRTGS